MLSNIYKLRTQETAKVDLHGELRRMLSERTGVLKVVEVASDATSNDNEHVGVV